MRKPISYDKTWCAISWLDAWKKSNLMLISRNVKHQTTNDLFSAPKNNITFHFGETKFNLHQTPNILFFIFKWKSFQLQTHIFEMTWSLFKWACSLYLVEMCQFQANSLSAVSFKWKSAWWQSQNGRHYTIVFNDFFFSNSDHLSQRISHAIAIWNGFVGREKWVWLERSAGNRMPLLSLIGFLIYCSFWWHGNAWV